jgi:hypothetical protein
MKPEEETFGERWLRTMNALTALALGITRGRAPEEKGSAAGEKGEAQNCARRYWPAAAE